MAQRRGYPRVGRLKMQNSVQSNMLRGKVGGQTSVLQASEESMYAKSTRILRKPSDDLLQVRKGGRGS